MRGPDQPVTQRARSLRQSQTGAEALLWGRLRARRLNGFKFVRQVPIGSCVADFACRDRRLIVEVDGATHSTPEELAYDVRRTVELEAHGVRVARFQNDEIFRNIHGVCETILAILEGKSTL